MPRLNPTGKTTLLNLPVAEKPLEGDDPAKPGRWISVRQYQILYGYDARTIRSACYDGRLKYQRRGNRLLVWDSAEVFPGGEPVENVPFIKMSEVAAILNCTVRYVRYCVTRRQLKAVRAGGRMYTTISELRKMIERHANSRKGKRKTHMRDAVINLVKQRLEK